MGDLEQLAEHIRSELGASVAGVSIAHGEITLEANAGMVEPVIKFLRDDPECAFSQLIDLCGVDYPERALRFDVVYHLLSMTKNRRIRVKVQAGEETQVRALRSFSRLPHGLNAKLSTCMAFYFPATLTCAVC